MLECRHRCSCCCEPVALEKAHIIPWSETKDHSLQNLVVFCANCHTRSHTDNWSVTILRGYKQDPCVLKTGLQPPLSPEQKAMVDLVMGFDPDQADERQRLRFISIIAAYTGVQINNVTLISVTQANSSRVRLELPHEAAESLIAGFQAQDPRLAAFMAEFTNTSEPQRGIIVRPNAQLAIIQLRSTNNEALGLPPGQELLPALGILRIEASTAEQTTGQRYTDTSEAGLETLIFESMTGFGWLPGQSADYNQNYALDLTQLRLFLEATQPNQAASFDLANDSPSRRAFLARIQGEITRLGIIEVLRHGIKHGKHDLTLFYGTPSPGNQKAEANYAKNRFSITRQLRYSLDNKRLALDLGLFINGLPVATFELKNRLTKQTVEDAVEQYQRDRDPRELLFQFKRCMVHFAVDDQEVRMCTELSGKSSRFLPFNQGWNDGAGNPPNPYGIKTDFLWKRILTPAGLTDIIENYAQVVEKKNKRTGKKKLEQVFPRYHQLDVVRRLLAHTAWHGAGKRYLIQHSAGSGKSNSIAWLAHQLIGVKHEKKNLYDSILVITDRRILDDQIKNTIKQFAQVGATIGHAENSGDLRRFIAEGKKIIISTIQKFPRILDEINADHRSRTFAILIDEAHSSQGGKTSGAMNEILAGGGDEADPEDTVNSAINARAKARQLATNASYFAFTATPKPKTLQTFGEPYQAPTGETKYRPFHGYTMKQAIQEGFILDVLANYTPVESYYKLVKKVEDDPEFDTKRAKKKLRRYVESHDHAIRLKAEIMIDHFQQQVIAQQKIGGQARAMVVCNGIERTIQYYHAFQSYLTETKSPHQAIVAFTGEHEYNGSNVTESSLNGFPSNDIPDRIQDDPYRFLICADKFQTGYDEPLLHTMYVDKTLAGIQAVQTLSRLNRSRPQKHDVFVLDFINNTETIEKAFSDYYRTTILSEETDPDKLHTLKSDLDRYQIYSPDQVDRLVSLYISGASRDQLDSILETSVAVYMTKDEDEQVGFKGNAKSFARTYDFLAQVLSYTNVDWEKLSIYLAFLLPKLPAPKEEDLAKGILETIDMDSYRVEKKAVLAILLLDTNAEIAPAAIGAAGHKPEPTLDRLSVILNTFNEQFKTNFTDADRVWKRITDIAPKVAADQAYQNAKKNTPQTARLEHDKALKRVIIDLLNDDTEFFRQFFENDSFRRTVTDTVFGLTQGNPEEPQPDK